MIEEYLKAPKVGDYKLEIVRLMPTLTIGPTLISQVGSSIEAFTKIMNGEFPGVPRLMFPHVDVRDVAQAHINAMVFPGVKGLRFLLSQQSYWMIEDCEMLGKEFIH